MAIVRNMASPAWLFMSLVTCAYPTASFDSTPAAALTFEDPPRRADVDVVLVVMPVSSETLRMRQALLEEIADDLDLVTVKSQSLDAIKLGRHIDRIKPNAIVLVDNRNVRLYRKYQNSRSQAASFPPAVVLMTSFVEDSIDGMHNTSAVGYEAAALTGMVAMRKVLGQPLARLGVVYRKPLAAFIERQEQLAKVEKLKFARVEVSSEPSRDELEWAVDQLVDAAEIDALWVLNDNMLLRPTFLREVWLPILHKNHTPVLVGVDALVNPKLDFGTLAVTPNDELLGVQAANMLLDLFDEDWKLEPEVQQPLSVRTVVNVRQARKYLGLNEMALRQIDTVLE